MNSKSLMHMSVAFGCGAVAPMLIGALFQESTVSESISTKRLVIQDAAGRPAAIIAGNWERGDAGLTIFNRDGSVAVLLGCGRTAGEDKQDGGASSAEAQSKGAPWTLLQLEAGESRVDGNSSLIVLQTPQSASLWVNQKQHGAVAVKADAQGPRVELEDEEGESEDGGIALRLGLRGASPTIEGFAGPKRSKELFRIP